MSPERVGPRASGGWLEFGVERSGEQVDAEQAMGGAGSGPRLVVVVPVFNERMLLRASVTRLLATPAPMVGGVRVPRTVLIVDDGSTDGTPEVVRELAGLEGVEARFHAVNAGKGAAIRTGFHTALRELHAEVVIIHDADLEYDPVDHEAVLRPIFDGRADAVIGSRFLGQTHRVLYYWHWLANNVITHFSNMMTNLNLSDIECCFKAFKAETLAGITIAEDRFGVEPELVAKLAKLRLPHEDRPGRTRRARIFEVPVSYAGRTFDEGKKIRWHDGVRALWCILRYNTLG